MPKPLEVFRTPNPTLGLRSDGYLVSITELDTAVRLATPAEFHEATDLAVARGIHILSTSGGGGDADWLWSGMSDEMRGVVTGVTTVVGMVVPVVGWVNAAIKAFELLGLTGNDLAPILKKIEELNVKLDRILAELSGTQKLVYAGWASGHWRAIATVLGQSSAALQAVYEVLRHNEDVTTPAVIQKLGHADNNSRVAVATLVTGGIDSGFWRRPHFPPALNMAAWQFKTDDRPDVSGDGLVWDHRIALPALLIAITARVFVLKTLYPGTLAHSRLCTEVAAWTTFLGALIKRVQGNVRRKIDFSKAERTNRCPGTTNGAYYAGAVDVTTGLADFINLDAFGNTALITYERKIGKRPDDPAPTSQGAGHWCYGGVVNTADFSDEINMEDVIGAGVLPDHAAILDKQARFAANRLLWKTPILQICDFSSMLWELCPHHPPLIDQVRVEMQPSRFTVGAVSSDLAAKRIARDAFTLADIVRQEGDTAEKHLETGSRLTSILLGETGPRFKKSLTRLVQTALEEAYNQQTPVPPGGGMTC